MEKFNIQLVCSLSGISPHTLRAWEKRYQIITPTRAENGRRLYNNEQLEKIKVLAKLTSYGFSIGKIAKLSHSQRLSLLQEEVPNYTVKENLKHQILTTQDIDKVLFNLLLALKNYKLDILAHELAKISKNINAKDFTLKVMSPLFQKVGEMVSTGELTIAQEHSLSAMSIFYIGEYFSSQAQLPPQKRGIKIVFATPENELHTIGIILSALLCSHYGFETIYLGENMPASSLIESIKALGGTHLVLGVGQDQKKIKNLKIEEYLKTLYSNLDEKFEVWLGGNTAGLEALILEYKNTKSFPSLEKLCDYLEKF